MAFYDEIARYYDDIFPVAAPQRRLLLALAGPVPAQVLDIACGTGGYSAALAAAGHEVLACDLDPAMVERAGKQPGVRAFVADMSCLAANPVLAGRHFDLIFCIGNSLVHLPDLAAVTRAIGQMAGLLRPGGRLLIQIINYDRIISQRIDGLPAIHNPAAGLLFERHYQFQADSGKLVFRTVLHLDGRPDGLPAVSLENSVELLALRSGELAAAVAATGYRDVSCFGDFDGGIFEPQKSIQLVMTARRPDRLIPE